MIKFYTITIFQDHHTLQNCFKTDDDNTGHPQENNSSATTQTYPIKTTAENGPPAPAAHVHRLPRQALKPGDLVALSKVQTPLNGRTLQQSDLHLIYLWCRTFTKLKQCSTPLQILSTPGANATTIVVGTMQGSVNGLTLEECKTLDKLIYSGTGIGLHRPRQAAATCASVVKQEHPEPAL